MIDLEEIRKRTAEHARVVEVDIQSLIEEVRRLRVDEEEQEAYIDFLTSMEQKNWDMAQELYDALHDVYKESPNPNIGNVLKKYEWIKAGDDGNETASIG